MHLLHTELSFSTPASEKNANYSIQKYNASVIQYIDPSHMLRTNAKMHIEETDHEDFSMIAMGRSCEYGNASLGLITNRYRYL
jgi:hypothetical protein